MPKNAIKCWISPVFELLMEIKRLKEVAKRPHAIFRRLFFATCKLGRFVIPGKFGTTASKRMHGNCQHSIENGFARN